MFLCHSIHRAERDFLELSNALFLLMNPIIREVQIGTWLVISPNLTPRTLARAQVYIRWAIFVCKRRVLGQIKNLKFIKLNKMYSVTLEFVSDIKHETTYHFYSEYSEPRNAQKREYTMHIGSEAGYAVEFGKITIDVLFLRLAKSTSQPIRFVLIYSCFDMANSSAIYILYTVEIITFYTQNWGKFSFYNLLTVCGIVNIQ